MAWNLLSTTGMITADSSNISTIVTAIEIPHTNGFTDSRVATLSFFDFRNIHTIALKSSLIFVYQGYTDEKYRFYHGTGNSANKRKFVTTGIIIPFTTTVNSCAIFSFSIPCFRWFSWCPIGIGLGNSN